MHYGSMWQISDHVDKVPSARLRCTYVAHNRRRALTEVVLDGLREGPLLIIFAFVFCSKWVDVPKLGKKFDLLHWRNCLSEARLGLLPGEQGVMHPVHVVSHVERCGRVNGVEHVPNVPPVAVLRLTCGLP